MGRLHSLLHVATPDATRNATSNRASGTALHELHTASPGDYPVQQAPRSVSPSVEAPLPQPVLHVAPPRECNTQQPDTLPDPAAEARRQRVLAVLAERPGIRYAVVVDNLDTDPVILALAVRGVATFELHVPKSRWDQFLFLDAVERHGGTIH